MRICISCSFPHKKWICKEDSAGKPLLVFLELHLTAQGAWTMIQEYFFPNSVDQAVDLLNKNQGKARIIAGGTDLVIEQNKGKKQALAWVDLAHLSELNEIEESNGNIVIGANVTFTKAVHSTLIQKKATALSLAARSVGSLQIRNVGTLVGNIVSANPAADSTVPLMALGASCIVVDKEGEKKIPLKDMYAGILRSAIDPQSQIVTHIEFPTPGSKTGTGYARCEARKALSLPLLNVAVYLALKDTIVDQIRIALAPCGPGPQLAKQAQDFLKGKEATLKNLEQAAYLTKESANFRSSAVRGSKEYRTQVLPVYALRALKQALDQAKAN